jgi:hypothetical protein
MRDVRKAGSSMPSSPTPASGRDEEISTALEQSAQAQEEAASVLRQVAQRLDKLSAEMRRHGAFPIVGSLERERQRIERQADAIANGR